MAKARAASVAGDSPTRPRKRLVAFGNRRSRAATTAGDEGVEHAGVGTRDVEAGLGSKPEDRPLDATASTNGDITLANLFYHPDDARAQHEGFHGRLSAEQEVTLSDLEALIIETGTDLSSIVGYPESGTPAEPERLCLLRFLRANDFKVARALAHITENVQWREEQGLRALLGESPQEVLGCDPEEVNKFFPHWNFGADRMGRPVLCKQYGGFKVWELTKMTSIEKMVRSHLWEQEKTLQQMRRRTAVTSQIVDSFVVIIDVGGMSIRQVTKDFLALMKQVAHVDQRMFPECLGAMFILNTPGLFSTIWAMFTPLLDPRTVAKIRIFSKQKDWQPALLELIDAAVLPPEYGGTGAPLAQLPSASTTCALGASQPLVLTPPLPVAGSASGSGLGLGERRRSRRALTSGLAAAGAGASGGSGGAAAAAVPAASDPGVISSVFAALGSWWHGVVDDDKSSVCSDEFFDVMAQMECFETDLGVVGPGPAPGADVSGDGSATRQARYSHRIQQRSSWRGVRRSLGGHGDTVPIGAVAPGARVLGDWGASVGKATARGCGFICAPALRRLLKLDVEELATWGNVVNGIFITLSIMVIAFGAYMISNMTWVSELVVWMMWCAVVMVCLGSLVLVLGLLGLAATRGRDRASLVMHIAALTLLSLVTLVVASCCFALAAGDNVLARISWGAVTKSGAIADDVTEAEFLSNARANLLLVGSGALVLGLFAIIPCLLAGALVIKLGRQAPASVRARLAAHEEQLRHALQEGTLIAFSFALVCIGYGSYALYYTLELGLGEAAGIVFVLLVEGVMIVILSALAVWAAASADVWPFNLHLLGAGATVALLVGWTAYTFVYLHQVDAAVAKVDVSMLNGDTVEEVATRIKVQMLVAGVLQLVTSFCLTLALSCSSQLRRSILRHGSLVPLPLGGGAGGSAISPAILRPTRGERLVVAWASVRGLAAVFVEGTFVIFHGYMTNNHDVWATGFWRAWGHVDERYVVSDPYITTMEGIIALLIGPALLFYAWAAYTRRRFRHVLGVSLSLSLVVLSIAAFGTEIHAGFENTYGQSPPAAFWLGFVLISVLRVALPALVLWYNVKHLQRRVAVAEVKYERLVEEHDRLRKYAIMGTRDGYGYGETDGAAEEPAGCGDGDDGRNDDDACHDDDRGSITAGRRNDDEYLMMTPALAAKAPSNSGAAAALEAAAVPLPRSPRLGDQLRGWARNRRNGSLVRSGADSSTANGGGGGFGEAVASPNALLSVSTGGASASGVPQEPGSPPVDLAKTWHAGNPGGAGGGGGGGLVALGGVRPRLLSGDGSGSGRPTHVPGALSAPPAGREILWRSGRATSPATSSQEEMEAGMFTAHGEGFEMTSDTFQTAGFEMTSDEE